MATDKKIGVVVYGATGYTGKLVCEYLQRQYGAGGEVTWAMAGRSADKLASVRDELGIDSQIELLVADADKPETIQAMVDQTQVVITTVGPYSLYGEALVEACANSGTDYVDLCGEPPWMRDMISKYQAAAKESGARIVFSCGFDSIPFDLGVLFLQEHAKSAGGSPITRVKGRVRKLKGTWSGGTVASLKATMAAAKKDPSLYDVLTNPFALSESFTGPEQPSGAKPLFEEGLNSWAAPFVMATINTKNIHRSNQLMGHCYGEDFVYDEMILTGPGDKGEAAATAVAEDKSLGENTLQPGDGPTEEERNAGSYDVLFVGERADGSALMASVSGDKDPGYGSTSKMITESAICLLKNPQLASGGIWTPAAAMGESLIERLQANAGLTFKLE